MQTELRFEMPLAERGDFLLCDAQGVREVAHKASVRLERLMFSDFHLCDIRIFEFVRLSVMCSHGIEVSNRAGLLRSRRNPKHGMVRAHELIPKAHMCGRPRWQYRRNGCPPRISLVQ